MSTQTRHSHVELSDAERKNWDDVKARLQARWNQIEDEDFQQSGTWEDLLGRIQTRSGDTLGTVQQFANALLADVKVKAGDWKGYAASQLDSVRERAASVRAAAGQSIHDQGVHAQEVMHEQVAAAQQHVRTNPFSSMAYAFGLGALVGLMLGSRRS